MVVARPLQVEAERVALEMRLALPRLHTIVDAHASAIRQIEDGMDSLMRTHRCADTTETFEQLHPLFCTLAHA